MHFLRRHIPELLVLVYAILFLLTKNPENKWDRVIVSDGKGYYAYLTAIFIYGDTDFGFIDSYESKYYPESGDLYKDFRFDTGKGIVNKYFPGPAVLWLPFFSTAHAVAHLTAYDADGYSLPYQLAVAFAAFFYFWLALLLLRKILRFYSDNETFIAWTIVVTALATNLIYYTVNAGCQVHVYNFFLINAFVYSVILAVKHSKTVHYSMAALSLGVILISRPQNGIIVFAIPFLAGNQSAFYSFFRNLIRNPKTLTLSSIAVALPILIPVTFWYFKTGNLLVYSYGKETYDLTNPHLLKFLFSFEKGWMLYTPVAALSVLGLIFMFRRNRWQSISLAAFLFLVVYFLSSWWIWTYTSYISQRVMIDFYVFIPIMLLYIFHGISSYRGTIFFKIILILFISLNVMQHFQQLNWVYPAGPVTAKSYFKSFFKFSKGSTFMIPENEIKSRQLYFTDFEKAAPLFTNADIITKKTAHSGTKAVIADTAAGSRLLFARKMTDYKDSGQILLKISGWVKCESTDSTVHLEVEIGKNRQYYCEVKHDILPTLKIGDWKYTELVMYLPYIRSVSDSLFVSVCNNSSRSVLLDDVGIEFIRMNKHSHHDWFVPVNDDVDTVICFRNNMETDLIKPWNNPAAISNIKAFSGSKSSNVNAASPYSIAFENELDTNALADGYIRVGAHLIGDTTAEVLLVFDFSDGQKQVYYKTYPVQMKDDGWAYSEFFRELPVAKLKARKVKIYFWYLRGNHAVYFDDFEVDFVKYKPAKIIAETRLNTDLEYITASSLCCNFDENCTNESGFTQQSEFAFSGSQTGLVNAMHPFSLAHQLPLKGYSFEKRPEIFAEAQVFTDQYKSSGTLVIDFRHKGKSVAYVPAYLRNKTRKGEWINVQYAAGIPQGITDADTAKVYFYRSAGDEEILIDDFCVSLKQKKH